MRRWALLFFACALSCNGPDYAHGRPRIDKLSTPEQDPKDPFTLRFTITFTDTDRDLGTGTLHVLLSGHERATAALSDLFAAQSPPIDAAATTGQFDTEVKIQEQLNNGDKIEIGFYLVDAQGLESNKPSVVLQVVESGGTS
jgi:hypothetical protein